MPLTGRLVGKAADVYQYLEPLYNDYRKIRRRGVTGCALWAHSLSAWGTPRTTHTARNVRRHARHPTVAHL